MFKALKLSVKGYLLKFTRSFDQIMVEGVREKERKRERERVEDYYFAGLGPGSRTTEALYR